MGPAVLGKRRRTSSKGPGPGRPFENTRKGLFEAPGPKGGIFLQRDLEKDKNEEQTGFNMMLGRGGRGREKSGGQGAAVSHGKEGFPPTAGLKSERGICHDTPEGGA